jgi:hypothetical protein
VKRTTTANPNKGMNGIKGTRLKMNSISYLICQMSVVSSQ